MRISACTDFRFYGTALPENAESRPPWCSLFSQPGLEPRPYTRRRNIQLFPSMHWGLAHSVGHYVDLWSAGLGLTLFPLGYFLDALTARRAEAWRLPGQSSSGAREFTITLYTERRVSGNAGLRKGGGARSPRALWVLTPRGVPVPRRVYSRRPFAPGRRRLPPCACRC
jgi:hypothetical protein